MLDRPYFMSNPNWYYFDFDEKEYKITKEATKEAKQSYEEYKKYKQICSEKGIVG